VGSGRRQLFCFGQGPRDPVFFVFNSVVVFFQHISVSAQLNKIIWRVLEKRQTFIRNANIMHTKNLNEPIALDSKNGQTTGKPERTEMPERLKRSATPIYFRIISEYR
jgi:hypothetical protein